MIKFALFALLVVAVFAGISAAPTAEAKPCLSLLFLLLTTTTTTTTTAAPAAGK